MARCGCSSSVCSCVVNAGPGITVTGSGSATDPYVISIGAIDLGAVFQVIDTDTLNLTLTGDGNVANPFVLSGVVTLEMEQLTDVDLSNTTVGNVLALQADNTYDLVPPSTAPVGAVSTDASIDGDGSGGDPLAVHDYANLARLAGSDATPNLQSIDFGDPADNPQVFVRVNRATFDETVEGTTRLYLINSGAGSSQSARLDYLRDGVVVAALSMSQTGSLLFSGDGSTFLPVHTRVFVGTVPITGDGNTTVEVTVNFPAGRFSAAPVVVGSVQELEINPWLCFFYNITDTEMRVRLKRADGAPFSDGALIGYHAIQAA